MNSLAAFVLILLALPIKYILHLEGMGAKTAGGGLIQIFSAACLVLCNRWTLEQFQPQQDILCMTFKGHCAILHCAEKQLGRGKEREGRESRCLCWKCDKLKRWAA